MSHFKYHVLVCTNLKANNKGCCAQYPVEDALVYLKEQTKTLGITGVGGVRVSSAGCLGRCTKRPVMVIYPEAVWYRFECNEDLQEIIDCHLVGAQIVTRLQVADFT